MMKDAFRQYTLHAVHVREIINPLKKTGIDGVFYTRIYNDGSIINLANYAMWTEFYFSRLDEGLYLSKHVTDQFYTYLGTSLWDLNPKSPVWQDAKKYFGYKNGILLVEDYEKFKEVFFFIQPPTAYQ